MTNPEADQVLDQTAAIADCFLDIADGFVRRGDPEQALRWNHVAARVLSLQNRELSNSRIEANLQTFAKLLPPDELVTLAGADGRGVWLHVITKAMGHGGHTAMVMRWMKLDAGRTHHVALLAQEGPVPEELLQAARESGGDVHVADAKKPFLYRAEWLRKLALRLATHVEMSIDMDDVVAGVAFARAGGPPVMLLNHAAHLYWVGTSVADVVLNCRGSEYEILWTRKYRGVPACATIPISLVPPGGSIQPAGATARERDEAKASLGIAKDSLLILTSGDSYKYVPFDSMDFILVCEGILRELPNASVVVVGAEENERWKAASERSGGRLRTVGRQPRPKMARYQQAADIYIEGFPFGSTTALLEAGLRGIPVVLSPAQCPPPYGTDGAALDHLIERANTLEEYKNQIVRLGRSASERSEWGQKIREAVLQHHTGAGWQRYVEQAVAASPRKHSVREINPPERTPTDRHQYWTRFRALSFPASAGLFEEWVIYAFWIGLRPQLDGRPRQDLESGAKRVRGQVYAAIGDRFYSTGDAASAKEFYRASLQHDPWAAGVHLKRSLLLFGKLGDPARNVVRSLRKKFASGSA